MSILDADDLTYSIDYTSDPANLILTVTFGPLAVKFSYQIEISYYNINDKIKKIVAPVFFLALPWGTGTTPAPADTKASPNALKESDAFFTQCKLDSHQVTAGKLLNIPLPVCLLSK